jgi:hypothetical protein
MGKDGTTADARLTVLSGHYKDTQLAIERLNKNRDLNFFYMLVLLVIMAFQFFSPQTSGNVLSQVIKKQLDIEATISINYIGSLIWFALLAVAIRYFQITINLEKQYNYIHSLEKELSAEYEGKAFTREGQSYLKNYPLFSEWLHILYRLIFPILFSLAVIAKLMSEWRLANLAIEPLILNTAIGVMLLISTGLFWYSLRAIEKDSYPDTKK